MQWDDINRLCDVVRETGFAIHNYLKCGHLEKVYENALLNRLVKRGLKALPQHPLSVFDEDGALIGDYYADLFIEDCLVVEIKACRALTNEHFAQILGYLAASRVETGLLINFGAPKFQIKKFVMTRRS